MLRDLIGKIAPALPALILSLNGQTQGTQTFATGNDANITLTISSSGGVHTFTPGFVGVLAASRGGIGTTTLGSLTVGSDLSIAGGQSVLIGTSTSISLGPNVVTSVTNGANVIGSISNNVLTLGWQGLLSVANGGTGQPILTQNALLLGNGANGIATSSVGTNGQILVGVTGSAPTFVTVSSDAGINNSGVLTLSSVNSNVGTFGGQNQTITATVNAKGLITSISTSTIAIDASQINSGVLAVTQGGTGQSILSSGNVLYGNGTNAVATSSNLTFNGSLLNVNGSLNASTSIITSATTTNFAIAGVSGCNILNATALGTIGCNNTAYLTSVLAGTNINISGGNTVNLNSNVGLANLWATGFLNASTSTFTNLNASSSIVTNSTTTGQTFLTGVSAGKVLALDQNGMIIATTTVGSGSVVSVTGSGNISSSGGTTPDITLNSNVLGVSLFSGTTMNASTSNFGTLNASSSILTNSTTTGQTFLTGVTAGKILALDQNGMIVATTSFLSSILGGTNINITGSNTVNLNGNVGLANLWATGFLNASTSTFTNLNASTSVLTNATIGNNTTTGQTFLTGVTAGQLLATNGNGMVISTTTQFITLNNLSGIVAAELQQLHRCDFLNRSGAGTKRRDRPVHFDRGRCALRQWHQRACHIIQLYLQRLRAEY